MMALTFLLTLQPLASMHTTAIPNGAAVFSSQNSFSISGHVYLSDSKTPVKGVGIQLKDTHEGHMPGYPGTVLQSTTSDQKGIFRFQGLEAHGYMLNIPSLNEDMGAHWVATSKFDSEKPWLIDYGAEVSVWIKRKSVKCDIRFYKPAVVSVDVVDTKGRPCPGWFPMLMFQGGGGRALNGLPDFRLCPGRYSFFASDFSSHHTSPKEVTVKEGQKLKIRVVVPNQATKTH